VISSNASALFGLCAITLALCAAAGKAQGVSVRVSAEPMHSGRISTKLAGGFIELLDDLVPGMWAEMLNDRSFEGVVPRSSWCYYTGAPNICDRQWDPNHTWTYDTTKPFNGARCVKLTAKKNAAARITQSGLATRDGVTYLLSGYLRGDGGDVRATVALKTLLPNGKWMALASARLPKPARGWTKLACKVVAAGTTDRAVFELAATGTGRLWADKLSLMPADNVKGWRRDVVRAVKEAHPGVIRWGGSVVDPGGYRWKEGIGDRDRRTPFPNKVWGRIDPNDVGIDEFCQFCDAVGAEPLICVSVADGAQSAHDLVEYCNGGADTEWGKRRVANDHRRPYAVRYFQIGNELGDAKYVGAALDFCEAIKAADPNAVIMSSYPSQELLNRVGPYLGYVCPHHYTPDLAACDANFNQLSEMLRNTPGCGNIKIGVTEWNISGGLWGLNRGRFLTLDCALANARYLNLLLRHSDMVEIACRSNMTNSLGSGMIQTIPAGLLKTPCYHVMKLYADHMKPVAVAVEGAPEGVDLAASASQDRKSVCIFAVNTKTEPVELSLDLSAYGGDVKPVAAEIVRDTQDMRQKDVMNHWIAPDRVRTVKVAIPANTITLPALSAAAIECGAGNPG
jgi:alpha-L-arabinofuranosidase